MQDQFGRDITYLRVSVTDRCNLRCTYCMPEKGVALCAHEDILSFEAIRDAVAAAVQMGVKKVRLTGGEPLLRKDIVGLVQMLSKIEGIEDLALTTNGILLPMLADKLKAAGLHRVNVSLDAMDPTRFSELTRGGKVTDVLRGIDAAIDAGLTPVKLNCVAIKGYEQDVMDVQEFAKEKGLEMRVIQEMNFAEGRFSVVSEGAGGDCARCNRMRLTSEGKIMPCLFSDLEFDVNALGFGEAFKEALSQKPEKGLPCRNETFQKIGG
ncbi:MAG: GTP 3',8-cyclase MoaA [Alphaproteobacteria bacterium]